MVRIDSAGLRKEASTSYSIDRAAKGGALPLSGLFHRNSCGLGVCDNAWMKKSDQTKERFAEALRGLAEVKPIGKVTVGEICARAGKAPATFYRHFRDKYDLAEWDHARAVGSIVKKEVSRCSRLEPRRPSSRCPTRTATCKTGCLASVFHPRNETPSAFSFRRPA